MNILHINTVDQEGGAAKIALSLFLSKNRKFKSNYLVKIKKSNNCSIKEIKPIGIVEKLGDFLKRLTGKDLSTFLRFNLIKLVANDIQFLKSNDIFRSLEYINSNIVHFHNIHGNYFKLSDLIKISKEKKIVWTLHDMWSITGHCANSFDCQQWKSGCGNCPYLDTYQKLNWDNSSYLWSLKKKIYKKSFINVVVPSTWLYKIVKKSILKNHKLHLIRNGVDIDKFKPLNKLKLKTKLNLPLDRQILLFSAYGGRENKWKGWPVIEKFINSSFSREDFVVICLGGLKQDSDHDTDNLIHVPKTLDESVMAQYYAVADLLLFPSKAENLPLSLMESMSCGTPAIAFDVGGVNEIINNNINGFLIRAGNDNHFIESINKWIHLSDNNKVKINNEARKTIIERFNIKDMISNYEQLYESV